MMSILKNVNFLQLHRMIYRSTNDTLSFNDEEEENAWHIVDILHMFQWTIYILFKTLRQKFIWI